MGRDRIVEIVCEELYEPGELDEDEVIACVSDELRTLHKEAASWPPITDGDRLDAAFAAMSARRIIALQNAGYTQSVNNPLQPQDKYSVLVDFRSRLQPEISANYAAIPASGFAASDSSGNAKLTPNPPSHSTHPDSSPDTAGYNFLLVNGRSSTTNTNSTWTMN